MDKKDIENIRREIVECFKVLYNDLHTAENWENVNEEIKKKVADLKELISICDDVDLRVKFVCLMHDGTEKHSKYKEIQKFVEEGIDLVEGAEGIQVQVMVRVRKGSFEMQTTEDAPFYVSERFIIEENSKGQYARLMKDTAKTDPSKPIRLISRENIQEWSNNRIRFPENKVLEV